MMKDLGYYGLPAILALALINTACTSTGGAEKPQADRMSELQGRQISPPIGLLLAGMDENRDATLTEAELQSGFEAIFAIGDKDQSQSLSATEFTQWSEVFLGETYSMPSMMNFDLDQNSSVSRQEFDATLDEIVSRFDRNSDGALVRAELLTTLNIPALDPEKMRQQMEAEMRKRMEEAMRRRRAGSG